MIGAQASFALRDAADVGAARRAAVERAKRLGFDDTGSGRVALLVTEAGTNILKHAGHGEIVIGERRSDETSEIEVLALDRGPGMADVDRCLQDGYSTAGSAGTGLGALKRMSSAFDVYSAVGLGTALLSRIESGPAKKERLRIGIGIGAVSVPLRGEEVCGDQWTVVARAGSILLCVVDGLGHGKAAFDAAHKAAQVVHEHAGDPPDQVLQWIHGALRSTRGAAGAIADIGFTERTVRYAGIGNISGMLVTSQGIRGMVSQNGTLGAEARRFQTFDYPLAEGAHVVMHSDGLSARWEPQRYPGLLNRDPSLIAGVLYRDYARGRDDATIVVVREDSA